MSEERVLAEVDNPKILVIVGAVVFTCLVLVVMVIGVDQFYKFTIQEQLTEKVLAPENPQLRGLRADETARLTRYQWVDKDAGIVRIPLDRAIELTLRDWPTRPTGLAAPVDTTTPPTGEQ